jgi:NTP pyrophosphatase (non-canonical NTP hydrolase)
MEVRQLQDMVVAKRSERGFVNDPVRLCVLLTEEVGELASEIKKTWSANYSGTTKEKLSEECSDVFCVLMAMAQAFDIDIEEAVVDKFFSKDEERKWATQKQQG